MLIPKIWLRLPIALKFRDGRMWRIPWWTIGIIGVVLLVIISLFLVPSRNVKPKPMAVPDPRDAKIAIMETELTQLHAVQAIHNRYGFSMSIAWAIDESSKSNFKPEEWKQVKTREDALVYICELIQYESGGVPTIRGDSGRACGLSQLWESTARQYDDKIRCEQLLDPETHMRYFWLHWRDRLRARHGSVIMTALDWNRGSSQVDRDLKAGVNPDNKYLEKKVPIPRRHAVK
jgi:hypothetical protein